MQEYVSGSGRLSMQCLTEGLKVAFPVDYRYGWDLGCVEHQRLLKAVRPGLEFYAPRCTAWSVSSNRADPLKRATARAAEKPTLDWVSSRLSS
eukprot:3578150-Lingulodinium_polyedra.AAC.1